MLIALLLVLGVDLIVLVAVVALFLGHKRWVLTRPGAFPGAVKVVSGEVGGFRSTWTRGSGRWIHHTLMWTKGPLLIRTELLDIDGGGQQSPAGVDQPRWMGRHPTVVRLTLHDAVIDVATAATHDHQVRGPHLPARGPEVER